MIVLFLKCLPQAHMLEDFVFDWWWCFERLQNLCDCSIPGRSELLGTALKVIVTSGSHISDPRQIHLRNDCGHCNTVTLRWCLHMPLESSPLTSAPEKVTCIEILMVTHWTFVLEGVFLEFIAVNLPLKLGGMQTKPVFLLGEAVLPHCLNIILYWMCKETLGDKHHLGSIICP